jgi:hypothetical protein
MKAILLSFLYLFYFFDFFDFAVNYGLMPRKGLEGRVRPGGSRAFFAPSGAKNGAKRSLQSATSCVGFPAGAHPQIRFADLLP